MKGHGYDGRCTDNNLLSIERIDQPDSFLLVLIGINRRFWALAAVFAPPVRFS